MGILIKNPEAERAVRELAELTGESLTTAIEVAVRERIEKQHMLQTQRRRPTVEDIMAATERFRKAVGLDKLKLNITQADFDELNDIPGLELRDDAP